jgi:hypothetical protein
LDAPLISLSSFGSIQFTNLSIVKRGVFRMRNADVGGNICGTNSNGPALLIKDSIGMISSSTFQNIETGFVLLFFNYYSSLFVMKLI